MHRVTFFSRMIWFALATFILLGCSNVPFGPAPTPSPIPPTPTPTPMPGPKLGQWNGDDLSFVVAKEGTITEFEITVGDCQVTLSEEIFIDPNGSFGSFTINPEGVLQGSSAETATDFRAEAEFQSETTLSGTYSVQICGGWMFLSSSDVAWTAEWQSP